MSWSFVLNLVLCVIGIRSAWLDHGQTYNELKSATGEERRKKREKLIFLWGVPIVSVCLLPFTWSDNAEIGSLSKSVRTTSNAMHSATQDLSQIKSNFNVSTQELAKLKAQSEDRHLTDNQKAIITKFLKRFRRVRITIQASFTDREAAHFANELRSFFGSLRFDVEPVPQGVGMLMTDSTTGGPITGMIVTINAPPTTDRQVTIDFGFPGSNHVWGVGFSLEAADVPFNWSFDTNAPRDHVNIQVGSKPAIE